MIFDYDAFVSEKLIRARSHIIWLSEGRPAGRAEEHWFCAKMELEAEFGATAEEFACDLVVPRWSISPRPHRHEAQRIEVKHVS